jgi:hypothetical protein
MADKHTTKIIVTEQKVIHKGQNRTTQREYTIYQVIAQKETGEPIPEGMNLRSFDELPKNQLIEVEVEKYTSEQYGVSYTVSAEGEAPGQRTRQASGRAVRRMKRLNARLEAVERAVGVGGAQQPAATQPPPAAPPQGPPPSPPPSPVGDGMPKRRHSVLGRDFDDTSGHSGLLRLRTDRRVDGRLHRRDGLGEGHLAHLHTRGGHR